ncbi:FAD-dependent 5-carboxymethylaminomethyl-2-thiouridine(34) oxidoreductase MnmC [Shewanella sp. Isolate11]|uniref:FAD-dependent 5-carboxymethylaminomethyl-2-thiouridine(34) oxidoreductase MnmC n=1 Tax=Shewanella sp. Isolate11 TaxID=2908530 RepID=UPI001EFE231F|nr:FAD-dependent 5-carboxymethylaminomethyl-2-thiouridine(34) oxidoreductase MnmC [Shewanella sp. Isolate11]MCG9696307.1 FAD-dependent 5-carboxymethylaminomethyl-2-thiouridine(34) oxidoreductase MnmC [Shewanella sp. Isolate11]
MTDLLSRSDTQQSPCIAIMGEQLTPLLQRFAVIPSSITIVVHLFIAQHHDLADLVTQCHTFDGTSLEDIRLQLNDIYRSECQGSHTVIAREGKSRIHLHIGEIETSLRKLCSNGAQGISHWIPSSINVIDSLSQGALWQMARLSTPQSQVLLPSDLYQQLSSEAINSFYPKANQAGFALHILGRDSESKSGHESDKLYIETKPVFNVDNISKEIALKERQALKQQQDASLNDNPLEAANTGNIAIIGGGVASACLALSLAERGQAVSLFCMDQAPGQQASGNKQGAIYPLLTPEHGVLSHYFIQGYLFSRQRILSLTQQGFDISHDFCGILQTGFDQRSHARLDKIITSQPWAASIAQAVSAEKANQIAGIEINHPGIYYPLGGWVSPQQLSHAAIDKAAKITQVEQHYQTHISEIHQRDGMWYLEAKQGEQQMQFGPFSNVVLANGRHLTDYPQTQHLPISGFRGQVSHIPSRGELRSLNTVLCSHGYLTPSHEQLHCTGASYIKDPDNLDYSSKEQLDNLYKIRSSYDAKWAQEQVDISGHSARVGVRMVTRDHAPMMGCAPDFESILSRYQALPQGKAHGQYWQAYQAPIHHGLYVLGGLGSRGLTSGPLAAELLAAQLCGEIIPTSVDVLRLLNPNRMWMRKLVKGKALF